METQTTARVSFEREGIVSVNGREEDSSENSPSPRPRPADLKSTSATCGFKATPTFASQARKASVLASKSSFSMKATRRRRGGEDERFEGNGWLVL